MKKAIASKKLALSIIERVAAKHQLPVQHVLCARRDRYAVTCRAEAAWVIREDLGWSQRDIGSFLGVTQPAARKLLGYHEIAMRRANNVLPTESLRAIALISTDEAKRQLADAQIKLAYLQSELDRLTGASITQRVAESFGLESKIRCAIVLSIVAEAYPRAVNAAEIVGLYDEACERLNYGAQRGASFNLISKNIAALRERFEELGHPDPIASTEGSFGMQRRLTDDAAALLNRMIGAPRLSQLEPTMRAA